ncbi:MAG: YdcF family protein [Pyrinomonadaceae bacterium]
MEIENKSKPQKRYRWLVLILLPFLLLLAAKLAGDFLIVEKPLPQSDVIFVLSGSLAYGERTNTAAEVFHLGLSKKIILTNDGEQSSWEEGLQRRPFYWEWERANLIGKGVPAETIEILPTVVKDTHDEAIVLAQAARQQNWKSVLIVTSPFHTRRALWTANRAAARENVNIEIGMLAADKERQTRYWWTSIKNWRIVASEYLKFVYNWIFY